MSINTKERVINWALKMFNDELEDTDFEPGITLDLFEAIVTSSLQASQLEHKTAFDIEELTELFRKELETHLQYEWEQLEKEDKIVSELRRASQRNAKFQANIEKMTSLVEHGLYDYIQPKHNIEVGRILRKIFANNIQY